MAYLKVEGLAKAYGEAAVLGGIDFSVEEGEFVSIVGPSGCGKSTLFSIIGGIVRPDAGSVILEGKEITGMRGHVSYMPQSPSLFPWRTVLANAFLGGEIAGDRNEGEALRMLEKAGLSGYENKYPHELSGGMKQRVSFVRSLLTPKPLILMDEPFSALDDFTRRDMQKWLLSIWSGNRRTILFITHNLDEAALLSDKIIVLSRKPAKVKNVFTVPREREKREEWLLSDDYLPFKRSLLRELNGKQDRDGPVWR